MPQTMLIVCKVHASIPAYPLSRELHHIATVAGPRAAIAGPFFVFELRPKEPPFKLEPR